MTFSNYKFLDSPTAENNSTWKGEIPFLSLMADILELSFVQRYFFSWNIKSWCSKDLL